MTSGQGSQPESSLDETAVREDREYLQAVLATLPGIVAIWNINTGDYSFISPACQMLLGFEPAKFLTAGLEFVLSRTHPADRRALQEKIALERERYNGPNGRNLDAEPANFEFRIQRADGRWCWHHTVTTVFDRNAAGFVERVLSISLDVTERHEAEEQLRRAHQELEERVQQRTASLAQANAELQREICDRLETARRLQSSLERFDLMVKGSQVGLWDAEVDVDNMWNPASPMYFSPRLKEIFGYHDGEFPNVFGSLAARFHPDEFLRIKEVVERHLFQHEPFEEIEFRGFNKDGEERWYNSQAQGIWDANGRPVRMSGSIVDITHRKRAEERQRQDQDFLRSLLKAHERDRQLLALDFHDGLMPKVTAAQYFLEALAAQSLLTKPRDKSDLKSALDLVQQAVVEGRRLLNGLRPLILDDEGIQLALEYLVAEQSEPGSFKIDLKQELGATRLDPSLEVTIYRIVQEALTNARRYSRSPKVEVRLSRQDDTLQLSIRDWGVGFDLQNIPSERLGLRGMRRRAALHGGEAIIESKPGAGTSILVRLPVGAASTASAD